MLKERWFNASFLISFSIGYTGASFTKGKEIMPSHNSLRQQHLKTCVSNICHRIIPLSDTLSTTVVFSVLMNSPFPQGQREVVRKSHRTFVVCVCVCVCGCVRGCMCVCMCGREREKETERVCESGRHLGGVCRLWNRPHATHTTHNITNSAIA